MLQGVSDPPHERRSLVGEGLDEGDLAATWLEQFRRWLADAQEAGIPQPNATLLATANADARPGGRTVLLKDVDEQGFVVYTNLESRKGREIHANPRATLVFPWYALHRQVIIDGAVSAVGDAAADAYFATRPRGAQLGAWASPQSRVIPSRAALEEALAAVAQRFPGDTPIPRPPHWSGLRIAPDDIEFWSGRIDRLHDRLRFHREGAAWVVQRLAP
jgi:pyridoxamine 5'-phosphate oxidase